MDHQRVVEIAQPFLGRLERIQTNWTPLNAVNTLFHRPEDDHCPWQFEHVTAI